MGLVRRGHAVEGGKGSGETVPPQFFSFNGTAAAAATLIFIPQRQNNRDCTAQGLPFFYLALSLPYVHTCMSGTRPAARPYGL